MAVWSVKLCEASDTLGKRNAVLGFILPFRLDFDRRKKCPDFVERQGEHVPFIRDYRKKIHMGHGFLGMQHLPSYIFKNLI